MEKYLIISQKRKKNCATKHMKKIAPSTFLRITSSFLLEFSIFWASFGMITPTSFSSHNKKDDWKKTAMDGSYFKKAEALVRTALGVNSNVSNMISI